MHNTIQLDTAIKQMRALSDNKTPFSFSFTSFNKTDNTSQGITVVKEAVLHGNASPFILNYFDIAKQKHRSCYACLIMSFNNQQIHI